MLRDFEINLMLVLSHSLNLNDVVPVWLLLTSLKLRIYNFIDRLCNGFKSKVYFSSCLLALDYFTCGSCLYYIPSMNVH